MKRQPIGKGTKSAIFHTKTIIRRLDKIIKNCTASYHDTIFETANNACSIKALIEKLRPDKCHMKQ